MIHARSIRILPALVLLVVLLAGGASWAAEKSERNLTLAEGPGLRGLLRVENLLGAVSVRGGDRLEVTARVVAEAETLEQAQALAESIRLVSENQGEELFVRVEFPVEAHAAFKLPRTEAQGIIAKWIKPLIQRKTVATEYSGQTVEVGKAKGAVALAVYVKITMPHDRQLAVRQLVGPVHATGLRGEVELETIVGRAVAQQIFGTLDVRTSSGEIEAWKFRGERCHLQTGSGDLIASEIDSEQTVLRTESGLIDGQEFRGAALHASTATGEVSLQTVESASVEIEGGSGAIELGSLLKKLRAASVRSDSGDVTVRLGALAPFELRAESASGSVNSRLDSAKVLEQGKHRAHVQRGTGGAKLKVESEKGSVVLKPN